MSGGGDVESARRLKLTDLRETMQNLRARIDMVYPASREKSLALTKFDEAGMCLEKARAS